MFKFRKNSGTEKVKKSQKYKYLTFAIITSLIIAGGGCSLYFLKNQHDAELTNNTDNYVKIEEIWDSKSKKFNSETLTLFSYICGEEASYSVIKDKALTELTATDIRGISYKEKKKGKDILVTIDGIDWQVEGLSSDTDGNPMLTLWAENQGVVCTDLSDYLSEEESVEEKITEQFASNQISLDNESDPTFNLNLKKVANDVGLLNWSDLAATKFANEKGEHLSDDSIGTKENPYQISSGEELALLAKDTKEKVTNYENKYFVQTKAIMLSGHDWDCSIGEEGGALFYGTYDGQNYSIFDINGSFLFYFVAGSVKNVNVASGKYCGMIGNLSWGGTNMGIRIVENCTNSADIKLWGDWPTYAAGIVISNSGTIKNCVNKGNITDTAGLMDLGFLGGIVGTNYNGIVENCINYGRISGNNETEHRAYVGGIVGEKFGGRVEHCTNYGDLYGCYVGGIIGWDNTNESIYTLYPLIGNISDATLQGAWVGGLISQVGPYDEPASYLYDIKDCIVLGSLIGDDGFVGQFVCPYQEYYDPIILVTDCYFVGTCNYSMNIYRYCVMQGCYIWCNQTKVYSDEESFEGDDCGWGIVEGLNNDLPVQKELFWLAEVAELPQNCSSVLEYLQSQGFEQYVSTE